jgi:hypothetical protein
MRNFTIFALIANKKWTTEKGYNYKESKAIENMPEVLKLKSLHNVPEVWIDHFTLYGFLLHDVVV